MNGWSLDDLHDSSQRASADSSDSKVVLVGGIGETSVQSLRVCSFLRHMDTGK